MWDGVDRLGGAVLDASLATTAWLGLIALAMVGCRQPVRRRVLARAALLGCLVLMPLAWLGPAPRIDLLGPLRAPTSPTAALTAGHFAAMPSAWQVAGRWVPRLLTLLYLAGVVASLAWLLLGWWGLGWLARRSGMASSATRALYETLPFQGWRPRPRLRVASRPGRPVLLGVLRPLILIPPELDRPEAREPLRLSLLHELAHAERHDPWFNLAGSLAQAAWFFLPLVGWVRVRMRLDQEFLADRHAARGFGAVGAYASSLVALADAAAPPLGGPPCLSGAAPSPGPVGGSPLFQRVLMLVRCPFPLESRLPITWRLLFPPAAALGMLVASGLSLRGPEPVGSHPGPPQDSVPNAFQLPILRLAESWDQGAPRPYNLPLALPERFELTLEVFADLDALAEIRIVGHRIGWPWGFGATAPSPPQWHQVRLVRDTLGVVLWVDDIAMLAETEAGPASPWLSVQPAPRRPGLFRNLKLTW